MPKKKQQRNSFYFYMKELQEAERQKGNNYSMAEMSTIASPRWNCLSPQEKEPYEQMVRDWKASKTHTFDGKFTSDGYSIKYIQQLEEEEKEQEQEMIKDVQLYVRSVAGTGGSELENIAGNNLYIMSFNLLCRTEESIYIPLEIGIVEYSIRDGIKNTYHKFIHPGTIPVGYLSLAKDHSEQTHNIPITVDFKQCDQDYVTIARDIWSFIKQNRLSPIVFSMTDQIPQTIGCLTWLQSVIEHSSVGNIMVRDLLILLLELRAVANNPYHSYSTAESMLQKNIFDYVPDTNCAFHESIDNKHCALGYAKRLCYMLSDALCEVYNIVPTSKHLPTRNKDALNYEVVRPALDKNNKRDILRTPGKPYNPVTSQPTMTYHYPVSEGTSGERARVVGLGRGVGIGRGRPTDM